MEGGPSLSTASTFDPFAPSQPSNELPRHNSQGELESTHSSVSGDESDDLDDSASVGGLSSCNGPPSRFGPRLAPIGAPADESISMIDSLPGVSDPGTGAGGSESIEIKLGRLKMLEEKQEDLNSSLLNLTSHFAQVQFRLKQIINAPPHLKQDLLGELEEFASKGCVDTRQMMKSKESLAGSVKSRDDISTQEHEAKLAEQKRKQQELITELKDQLMELETFAYESGQGELPQSVLVEKQKAMIDQLRSRLNINLDDFNHLSTEELKTIVDSSLQRIINPAKAKEDLLFQLQSQISDLERFIDFLMVEGNVAPVGNQALCSCQKKCPVHISSQSNGTVGARCSGTDHHCQVHSAPGSTAGSESANSAKAKFFTRNKARAQQSNAASEQQKQESYTTVKKTMYLIQMYLLANMGCVGGKHLKGGANTRAKEQEMRSEKEEFDLMFKMRLNKMSRTVDFIIEKNTESCIDTDYFSDSSDTPSVLVNADLVKAVRRNLVHCLKELLQFSVIPTNDKEILGRNSGIVSPFNCFSGRSAKLRKTSSALAAAHIWQLFLSYYEIKNGNDYVHTPARKLNDAFRLDTFAHPSSVTPHLSSTSSASNVSRPAVTAKQTILAAIHDIVSTHEPLRRNYDSQFKAFVCRGLNEKRLALWFRLVLRTQEIVDRFYTSWTFMSKAYFDDITKLLERFSQHNFSLPVNMAVKPIRNIKDAF